MSKTRVFALILLLSAFALPAQTWSQQAEEKPTDNAAEKKSPEKHVPASVRCQMNETCITKVFFLTNLVEPNEIQDLVNTLRTIVELQRVSIIPTERAIIIKGSAEQLTSAEKLVTDIDKAKKRFGTSYRLEFTLSELEAGKKISTKTYSVLADPTERMKLSLSKGGQTNPLSSDDQPRPINGGESLNCMIRGEAEQSVFLQYDLELALPTATPNTSLKSEGKMALDLNKTAVIASIEAENKRTLQLEVKATRTK